MLMAVLLVAFAAGIVMASVQATAMELKMSLSADSEGGCAECPANSDGGPISCAAGCVMPAVGLIDLSTAPMTPAFDKAPPPAFVQFMSSWQAPPDPFPPRTSVLN